MCITLIWGKSQVAAGAGGRDGAKPTPSCRPLSVTSSRPPLADPCATPLAAASGGAQNRQTALAAFGGALWYRAALQPKREKSKCIKELALFRQSAMGDRSRVKRREVVVYNTLCPFSFQAMNDFWTAISAVVAVVGIAAGAFRIGLGVGHRRAVRDLNSDRERNRFAEIYAPIYGLFTTCHITAASARGAPYIRQRIRNAVAIIVDEHRVLAAAKALFDKQDLGTSAEVEYGGHFPLSDITKRLRGREQYADQALLNLVARSNRSQYEDMPDNGQLTDADLRLFNHICREYEKLSNRFAKA